MNVAIPIGKRINLYDLFKTDNIDDKGNITAVSPGYAYIYAELIDGNKTDSCRVSVKKKVLATKLEIFDKKFDLNTTIGHFKFELITRMFEDHSFMSYFQSLETEKENKIRSMWISY